MAHFLLFFYFLDHFGFTNLFIKLEPKSKERNSPVAFMRIVFIYMMRIVTGLHFFCTWTLLFFEGRVLCALSVSMVEL